MNYREWSGYYAVSVYEMHHDHEYNAIRNASAVIDVSGPSKAIQAMGGTRRGASATTKINRQDFGLTYLSNKLPGGDQMIGDDVTITLDIEMVQK